MNYRTVKLIVILIFCTSISIFSQNKISITIDDVPNTRLYQSENYASPLLDKIDSLNIPVAIFINEGLIYKTDSVSANFALLNRWIKNKNTTIGNHTFSHSKYSEVGFNAFKMDVEKGEYITRELAKKHNKKIDYFRFPYNDLGIDSAHHVQMDSLLEALRYISTPFTVESSDWMFNRVYEFYLNRKEYETANKIGNLYVSKTIEYFLFFDALAIEKYGRKINPIYLCHDNKLNADFLVPILSILKSNGYEFVSLEEALKDEVYQQEDEYYFKWGVSWLYRWIKNNKERIAFMRSEPDMKKIEEEFNNIEKGN